MPVTPTSLLLGLRLGSIAGSGKVTYGISGFDSGSLEHRVVGSATLVEPFGKPVAMVHCCLARCIGVMCAYASDLHMFGVVEKCGDILDLTVAEWKFVAAWETVTAIRVHHALQLVQGGANIRSALDGVGRHRQVWEAQRILWVVWLIPLLLS
jgi:hypothetical protein